MFRIKKQNIQIIYFYTSALHKEYCILPEVVINFCFEELGIDYMRGGKHERKVDSSVYVKACKSTSKFHRA